VGLVLVLVSVGTLALDFLFELPKPRPFLKEFKELIRTEEV
jgi:hypothetical protein